MRQLKFIVGIISFLTIGLRMPSIAEKIELAGTKFDP